MNPDHLITCMCPTCKVDTPHKPSRTAGIRRTLHVLKIAIAAFTMGFVFPNALADDDMAAACERCGKSIQVPYSG